ncbi:hypothetical protein UFOVP67_45 [uncultured Caudovirales phage]|uniref:Uncharacterized protein n=1 Tax=uncultured Caudovirales phage TaxID=2100421 RepID=A0A6J5TAT3_9CAUD|nr:hypothetical protein UFOVP67_45 [uncultured Caudovirales phage]
MNVTIHDNVSMQARIVWDEERRVVAFTKKVDLDNLCHYIEFLPKWGSYPDVTT